MRPVVPIGIAIGRHGSHWNRDWLGSFKLSYVSPENHKIGKMGWWKMEEKKWSLEAENGLREFFVG